MNLGRDVEQFKILGVAQAEIRDFFRGVLEVEIREAGHGGDEAQDESGVRARSSLDGEGRGALLLIQDQETISLACVRSGVHHGVLRMISPSRITRGRVPGSLHRITNDRGDWMARMGYIAVSTARDEEAKQTTKIRKRSVSGPRQPRVFFHRTDTIEISPSLEKVIDCTPSAIYYDWCDRERKLVKG